MAAVFLMAPSLWSPTHAGWPQDNSDLRPDPSVRFGHLANGMRYAIEKYNWPLDRVSMRLRFASGSLQEMDSQQGLAHFVEHMAFLGSAQTARGEVEKSLQRLGLTMGGDINAYTAESQTVYRFDLAKNDELSVRTGLKLMRETCDQLTLDAKTFDVERGVLISEFRLNDSPWRRSLKAYQDFALAGEQWPHRPPIGRREVLKTAPVAAAREYYRTWYRPERAAMFVAGNVDVDKMEKQIVAQFADWKAQGPPPLEQDMGAPMPRGPSAAVSTNPARRLIRLSLGSGPLIPPPTLWRGGGKG